jgi:hypothetical protein
MTTETDNRAERLARQRSSAAIVMGIILIVTQGQRMDDGGAGPIGWLITGVITLLFLIWASGVFGNTALRRVLNDESSELNRKRALIIAFWNMLLTAAVCYALTYVKDYGPRDAIQIIMTVGISSALIGFGASERIQMRL